MPQLITHNIFSKEVYRELSNDIKSIIKDDIPVYEIFSQSFDKLIYYFSLNIPKMKRIRKLSKKGHRTKVKSYFINILNNIKELNLEQDSQALSYLFGSINHYVLDSIAHPFIFYKTGVYDKKNKETKKYMGLHGDMETNIDAFFYINRYHKSYHKVNVTKEFIPKIKFGETLKNVVDKTFLITFSEQDVARHYFRSYKNSRILYRIFINDRYGIKRFLYKILDKIVFFRSNKFEYYTTYIKQPNLNYLNIEHNKWCYPSDKNIKSTESFIDLYNKALIKSKALITLAYEIIEGTKDIKEFENQIDNLSYVRGLDCENSSYMRTFEF